MKDPLAGGCIRLAAFELGRPRRSESDEVNLQTRPPKDAAPELGHNIRLEGGMFLMTLSALNSE